MIGRIRKNFMKKEDNDSSKAGAAHEEPPQIEKDKDDEKEQPGSKKTRASSRRNHAAIKRAVEQPSRKSVIGKILEDSFAKVKEDIQGIRDSQLQQGKEVKALAKAMDKLSRQYSDMSRRKGSQDTDDLAEELKDVRSQLDTLQQSHEMKFNTQLRDLLTQVEELRGDVDRHAESVLSEDSMEEVFRKFADKDFAAKHEVESQLSEVTKRISELSKRIQEKETDIKEHVKELQELKGRDEGNESVHKLFEDLNELDNEIIDLKRELNKERKLGLNIRKDLDELFSVLEGMRAIEASVTENTKHILDLQRVIGTDFKTKYY